METFSLDARGLPAAVEPTIVDVPPGGSAVAILYRLGLVRPRLVLLVPALSLVGCALAALVFVWIPDARSDHSTSLTFCSA